MTDYQRRLLIDVGHSHSYDEIEICQALSLCHGEPNASKERFLELLRQVRSENKQETGNDEWEGMDTGQDVTTITKKPAVRNVAVCPSFTQQTLQCYDDVVQPLTAKQ